MDMWVMVEFGIHDRNAEGQMVVDFTQRMDMAVEKTIFKEKRGS